MSDLHVYGHPLSQPSRSLIIFLKLSDILFEHHLIDLIKDGYLTEEFASINPFQLVPAIVHRNYNLWESSAIIAYIADAFNVDNNWYPKDIKIRGRINSYLHWHHQNVRDPIAEFLIYKIIAPKFFGTSEITPEIERPLKAKFEECLNNIKWVLAETGNIARTAEPSIADIFAYSELAQAELINFDLTPYPEVKAWYDRIGANKIVIEIQQTLKHFAIDFNSSPAL